MNVGVGVLDFLQGLLPRTLLLGFSSCLFFGLRPRGAGGAATGVFAPEDRSVQSTG